MLATEAQPGSGTKLDCAGVAWNRLARDPPRAFNTAKPPSSVKGIDYHDKARTGGQADACWELGLLHESGSGGRKEPGKAKNAFTEAYLKGFDDAWKKK